MGRSGARRARTSKRRTHVKTTEEEQSGIPKSMVIKMGDRKRQVSHALTQLVRDFRQVMEPHTAAKLQERKNNKLRDFVTMCGPLGVSHLFVFSNSKNDSTTLRIARTPRGPTLNFKVSSYSLNKDIRKIMKNPKSDNRAEYLNPPLLVMNGFTNDQTKSDMETLMSSMFQNMFPPISAQTTNVSGIKRVMMLNKRGTTIDIRHYAIETKQVDGSKQVRKLNTAKKKLHKNLPNMSRAKDISEFLLDPNSGGYTSESEVEEDSVVEMESQQQRKSTASAAGASSATTPTTKKAVKLVEIGPRLKLDLRKIEDGVCEGKTLYHSAFEKSAEEEARLEKRHKQRQDLRDKRRKEQEDNVKRKKSEQEGKMSRTKRGILKAQERENSGNGDDEDEPVSGSEGDDEEGSISEEEQEEDSN